MEVPVKELKNRLSEYLKLAQQGEEIIVTSHRRPVARLVPYTAAEEAADLVARLNAIPGVTWSGGKPKGGPGIRLRGQGKSAAEIVLEERD